MQKSPIKNSPGKKAGDWGTDPTQPLAQMFVQVQPRATLQFDDAFNFTRQIPSTHFSLMHMKNRYDYEKEAKYWAPGDGNTDNKPLFFIHQACLWTDAGKRWKQAWDGHLDRGYNSYLILEYGIFGDKDTKGHRPWNWKEDGNMAVSCQYSRIKNEYVRDNIDPSKFETILESSRQMILNLNSMFKFEASWVGLPVRSREYLEAMYDRQKDSVGH